MTRAFFCVLAMIFCAMACQVIVSAERTRMGYELELLRQQYRAEAGQYHASKAFLSSMRSLRYLTYALDDSEVNAAEGGHGTASPALLMRHGRDGNPARPVHPWLTSARSAIR